MKTWKNKTNNYSLEGLLPEESFVQLVLGLPGTTPESSATRPYQLTALMSIRHVNQFEIQNKEKVIRPQ